MSQDKFAQVILESQVFDVPKIIDICVIYGDANRSTVTKIVHSAFRCQPLFKDPSSTSTGLSTFRFEGLGGGGGVRFLVRRDAPSSRKLSTTDWPRTWAPLKPQPSQTSPNPRFSNPIRTAGAVKTRSGPRIPNPKLYRKEFGAFRGCKGRSAQLMPMLFDVDVGVRKLHRLCLDLIPFS